MKRTPLKRLLNDETGSILMLVALSLILLFAFAGAGYDLGRQRLVRSKIQQASDAAALAAALMDSTATSTDRQTTALRYFNLNYPANYMGLPRPTPTITVTSSSVTVSASASMNTSFVSNVGIPTVTSNGLSSVNLAQSSSSDYDVVMVVDESGSESAPLPPYPTREAAQQAAMTTMANSIVPTSGSNPNVRMGFIGFSAYISNRWGLSSNNADAMQAISNFRPIYQNFDHVALLAARNMLLGGQGATNTQYTSAVPNPQMNISMPNPRTTRTNPGDANGISNTKFVVFLSDGGIMIEPMDIHGGYGFGEDNYDLSGLVHSHCPGRGFWDGTNECFAAFNDACTQLRNTGGTDNVHVIIINTQTTVTPPELASLTACASSTLPGGPSYSPVEKPDPTKDFFYAANATELSNILKNVTTVIQKVRITQ